MRRNLLVRLPTSSWKGVVRLSDPMTMNKANTICSGVQNPSLMWIQCLRSLITLVFVCAIPTENHQNAALVVTDESGAPKGAGTPDGSGESKCQWSQVGQNKT